AVEDPVELAAAVTASPTATTALAIVAALAGRLVARWLIAPLTLTLLSPLPLLLSPLVAGLSLPLLLSLLIAGLSLTLLVARLSLPSLLTLLVAGLSLSFALTGLVFSCGLLPLRVLVAVLRALLSFLSFLALLSGLLILGRIGLTLTALTLALGF